MAATATTTITTPPVGYCPSGNIFQNLVAYINSAIQTTVTLDAGTGVIHYRQATTPAPITNGVWYRIGTGGFLDEPLGTYIYFNGRWVPSPNGRRIKDTMITSFDPTGHVDANGKGLFIPVSPATDTPNIAGPLFGWQLANNQNGSTNIKNRFLMAGYKYDATLNHWVSSVKKADASGDYEDKANGGREGITPTVDNFPPFPIHEYDSTKTAGANAVYGGNKWDNAIAINYANLGAGIQQAIQPVNPLYVSIGIFEWIGFYAASQS